MKRRKSGVRSFHFAPNDTTLRLVPDEQRALTMARKVGYASVIQQVFLPSPFIRPEDMDEAYREAPQGYRMDTGNYRIDNYQQPERIRPVAEPSQESLEGLQDAA